MRRVFWVVLVVAASISSLAIAETPAEPLLEFEFVVKLDESGATLTSTAGAGWGSASYGNSSGAYDFWLHADGVSSTAPASLNGGLLVHIVGNASGAAFESHCNTAWIQLDYGCGGDTPCEFVIDQFGVRGK